MERFWSLKIPKMAFPTVAENFMESKVVQKKILRGAFSARLAISETLNCVGSKKGILGDFRPLMARKAAFRQIYRKFNGEQSCRAATFVH